MDITARRQIEREKEALLERSEELLRQKQILLQEMQHRVANSLQIIASILILKARGVASEETRRHLRDAHQRVISVAEVQTHLHATDGIDRIDVRAYLSKLCSSLSCSMIREGQPVTIVVDADEGTIESGKAVSLGLIVTELVINSIKYAFPRDKADGHILVSYRLEDGGWSLAVGDNGVGKKPKPTGVTSGGLGTAIVQALAKQLDARLIEASDAAGMSVTLSSQAYSPRESEVLGIVG
jgi:chemotaxis protein methyltransferase CheR